MSMSTPEAVGSIEVALANAARLLKTDPALAVEQTEEILKAAPRQPKAHLMRGLALGAAGQGEAAVAALRRALELNPELPDAWRALGDHLTAMGDADGADAAYARHVKASTRDPRLLQAAAALCDKRIAIAEALLREHLKAHPTDVAAIRMLAEVGSRLGRYGDAENLLARCLELSPSFAAARHNYAFVLHRAGKPVESLAQIDRLLAQDPRNPGFRSLKASILARLGEVEQSIELYRGILEQYPGHSKAWMSYGHALKTAGEQEECIAAYRRSLTLAPTLGEAWWSLANLKTFRFAPADVDEMHRQLAREDLTIEDRFHFHFAAGKALEDAGSYEASFEHYRRGNELRRETIEYSAEENSAHVRRSKALFTPEFFAARAGLGCEARDPIFIVGLPRSGSTLLEQILASHPMVEGTQELPDIVALARTLGGKKTRGDATRYPEVLGSLSAEELRALGERYLEQTRVQRKTSAPLFVDKMPNNWAHVGMIHLILPNARIIDARRHPLACCFSGFKQHFARRQHFTYGLEEIGRYYRDYVELMAHFDRVLPGRVHRVIYEQLVESLEAEVRRLLDYCGLPFDERCLRYYENDRAVRTASSEQVRKPIFRDALYHWRNYDTWLGPLKQTLGPVLEHYPAVPDL
jgi:tetratricopeptide (TPR) repeat protein